MRHVVWVQVGAGVLIVGPTLIVIWSGAVVDIPAGWHLCDGTNATPDLRGYFVRGTARAVDSRYRTDGADTADYSHVHSSAGLDYDTVPHDHPIDAESTLSDADTTGGGVLLGGASGAAAHSHTLGSTPLSGAHKHRTYVFSGPAGDEAADVRPPYYALCYIQGEGAIPLGAMALLYVGDPRASGAVPSGYALCDGTAGTLDMTDLYVVGAGDEYLLRATGGDWAWSPNDHAHPNGGIAVGTDSLHSHANGTSYSETPAPDTNTTAVPTTYGPFGTVEIWASHKHRPHDSRNGTGASSGIRAEGGDTHTHPLPTRFLTYSIGNGGSENAIPKTYILHWVQRVS